MESKPSLVGFWLRFKNDIVELVRGIIDAPESIGVDTVENARWSSSIRIFGGVMYVRDASCRVRPTNLAVNAVCYSIFMFG